VHRSDYERFHGPLNHPFAASSPMPRRSRGRNSKGIDCQYKFTVSSF
jgi:hypothetical protein